ncbi:MAG: MCE family protein [Proteobacteria bacterium]|nr:MCE family protein [Pseudomonadota bacterium]
MQLKFRFLQRVVGGFFLLTCVIIVVLLVLVARGQRWFQPYTPYHCYFDRGGGLKAGSSVMIQGLEAGTIRRLNLEDDNRVRVDFEIYRQYADSIREGSKVKLSQPIIGSSRIEVALGAGEGDLIPPRGEIGAEAAGGSGLDELISSANRLVKELEDPEGDLMGTLDNINEFTKALAEKQGSIRMLVEKRKLYDELESAAGHLSSLLASIDDRSPDIQDSIVEARRGISEANKVIAALKKSVFLRGNIKEHLGRDSTLKADGRTR